MCKVCLQKASCHRSHWLWQQLRGYIFLRDEIFLDNCSNMWDLKIFSEKISGNRDRQKKKKKKKPTKLSRPSLENPKQIYILQDISKDNPFVCGTVSHGPPCQSAFMVHDTQPHPTHMHNHLSQTQAELALQVCIDLTDAYVIWYERCWKKTPCPNISPYLECNTFLQFCYEQIHNMNL